MRNLNDKRQAKLLARLVLVSMLTLGLLMVGLIITLIKTQG